jgi:hypothetical protein
MSETIYDKLDRIERANAVQLEPVETPATGLGYLQQVYNGEVEPDGPRMRAAIAALPFESPKLSVVANINNHELGARLEQEIARAWARSFGARRAIEAQPVQSHWAEPVDHSLIPAPPTRGGFKRRF